MCIFLDIQHAQSLSLTCIVVESDCKVAVDLICSQHYDSHHFSPIIHSIRLKLLEFQQISVQIVCHESNS